MNKLKTIIHYECKTSFKYIWYFYAIQYAILALVTFIIAMCTGNYGNIGSNGIEINTMIYIGVLGVLGFKEDFKMLIQNGFNRKYIFIAELTMFAFISGIMALVDTLIGTLLSNFSSNYQSLFISIYGNANLFVNWLCLFLVYMVICTLFFLSILIINKIGKKVALYFIVLLAGSITLLVTLFKVVLSRETAANVLAFVLKSFGFMQDGSINYFFPVFTLVLVVSILCLGAYSVVSRTELR